MFDFSRFWSVIETKTRMKFSGNWWSRNEKYLFLCILETHAEFYRVSQKIIPTCYRGMYYTFMIRICITSTLFQGL